MFTRLLALSILVTLATPANSAIIHVPGDFPTIQAGIDASAGSDTILIAAGTYQEAMQSTPEGPSMIVMAFGRTLLGQGEVILDAQQSGRVVRGVEAHGMQFINLEFRNGLTSGKGGAINTTWGDIGLIRDCRFVDCRASWGGAIDVRESNATIESSLFSGCQADRGGAVVVYEGIVDIDDCIFVDNSADISAGALWIARNTHLDNSLILNCSAPEGGWATVNYDGRLSATNCTFVGSGEVDSGSFRTTSDLSDLNLDNCILTGAGADAVHCDFADGIDLNCCDVFDNAGGDFVGCIADEYGVDGNFSSDPLFCDVASGDYGIDASSPCAPEGNDCAVLIGAYGVACGVTSVEELPDPGDSSISAVKSLY